MSEAEVRAICAEYDVRIIPANQFPQPGETRAKGTMQNILGKYGAGHLRLVLSTLAETKGNQGLITESTLWATSDLVRACSEWVESDPTSWLDAWDRVPLGFIMWHVQELAGKSHMRHALAGAMYLMLVYYGQGKKADREPDYSFVHRVRQSEAVPSKRDMDVEKTIQAGKILLEVKAALPHGEFIGWLQREAGICYGTAQRYMRRAGRKVRKHESRLPDLQKRTGKEMARIGSECLMKKQTLPRGAFKPWVRDECEVCITTANVYMQIARLYGGDERSLEMIQATGLLILAQNKTPTAIRQKVADMVANGYFVTREKIEEMLQASEAKPAQLGLAA